MTHLLQQSLICSSSKLPESLIVIPQSFLATLNKNEKVEQATQSIAKILQDVENDITLPSFFSFLQMSSFTKQESLYLQKTLFKSLPLNSGVCAHDIILMDISEDIISLKKGLKPRNLKNLKQKKLYIQDIKVIDIFTKVFIKGPKFGLFDSWESTAAFLKDPHQELEDLENYGNGQSFISKFCFEMMLSKHQCFIQQKLVVNNLDDNWTEHLKQYSLKLELLKKIYNQSDAKAIFIDYYLYEFSESKITLANDQQAITFIKKFINFLTLFSLDVKNPFLSKRVLALLQELAESIENIGLSKKITKIFLELYQLHLCLDIYQKKTEDISLSFFQASFSQFISNFFGITYLRPDTPLIYKLTSLKLYCNEDNSSLKIENSKEFSKKLSMFCEKLFQLKEELKQLKTYDKLSFTQEIPKPIIDAIISLTAKCFLLNLNDSKIDDILIKTISPQYLLSDPTTLSKFHELELLKKIATYFYFYEYDKKKYAPLKKLKDIIETFLINRTLNGLKGNTLIKIKILLKSHLNVLLLEKAIFHDFKEIIYLNQPSSPNELDIELEDLLNLEIEDLEGNSSCQDEEYLFSQAPTPTNEIESLSNEKPLPISELPLLELPVLEPLVLEPLVLEPLVLEKSDDNQPIKILNTPVITVEEVKPILKPTSELSIPSLPSPSLNLKETQVNHSSLDLLNSCKTEQKIKEAAYKIEFESHSGNDVLKIIFGLGLTKCRQNGSHVIVKFPNGRSLVVPKHSDLKRGTLHSIAQSLSRFFDLST
jgi:predicted RNA binding protein YcfA (HicA-like mRNA interferase family)